MKSIRDIVNEIVKLEGKKSEVSIGDIREIVSIISDMYVEHRSIGIIFYINGIKRKKNKLKRSNKMASDNKIAKQSGHKNDKKKKKKGFKLGKKGVNPFKKK